MTFYPSEGSAIGYAQEPNSAYGTFVTPTNWLPVKTNTLKGDPKHFFPKYLRGTRAVEVAAVKGIRTVTGALGTSLFPDSGLRFFANALGVEQYTTGSTPTNVTTIAADIHAGDTTFSSTATFATNSFVQVDTNVSKKSETRKVMSASGPGPYTITVDQAFRFGHTSGVLTENVVAPYSHFLHVQPSVAGNAGGLQSLSILDYMGAAGSIDYSGMKVTKFDLKMVNNAEVDITYDFMGQQDVYDSGVYTPVWPTDVAYSPTQIAPTLNAVGDTNFESFDLSWDSSGKQADTFNTHTYPATVEGFEIKGALKGVTLLQALTGGAASQGYYADLYTATPYPISILLSQSDSNQITLNFPAAVLAQAPQEKKLGDWIKYQLDWHLIVDSSTSEEMTATAVNSNWLPYTN